MEVIWKEEQILEELKEEIALKAQRLNAAFINAGVGMALMNSYPLEFWRLRQLQKTVAVLKEQIPSQYQKFTSVFDKVTAERLPEHGVWDHAIDLKPDFVPESSAKTYPLSPAEDAELQTFLDENLAKGYIRPSKSPLSSPFFFVKKKDGKFRPVQDY